ncbi:MAG: glycosyltransferase, partial [Terriglobia bacterium]
MRDTLRILFLAHNVVEAGTYVRFYGLARELASLGHRVTLIAASANRSLKTRELDSQGIKLILTPAWFHRRLRNGGVSPEDVIARLAQVLSHDYDLIHASEHRPAGSLPAIAARAKYGSRYVSDWADLWGREGIAGERTWVMRHLLGRPESLAESRIHRTADAVTTVCSDLYERAVKIGVPISRLLRLPNGADTDLIRPSANIEAAR